MQQGHQNFLCMKVSDILNLFIKKKEAPSSPGYFYNKDKIFIEMTNKHDKTIAYEVWPTYDESKLKDETYTMIVQVNGKVRGKIEIDINTSKEEMESLAKEIENVQNFINGKEIVKTIVVPKKLVNIVVK